VRKVWAVTTAAGGPFPVVYLMSVFASAWVSHVEFMTRPVMREQDAEFGSAVGKHRGYDFDGGSCCNRQTNFSCRADGVVDSR
jgi:hypothetical protein